MTLLRIAIVGLLVAASAVARVEAQDAITWETDLARAQQAAGQSNRLVLVHFWGTWCQPCVRMDREVLSKPGLGKLLAPYYVACKVQVEQGLNEALAKQYGVDVYPCDIVMTAHGQIVHRSKGFQTAEQYVAMLQQAAQTAVVARSTPPAQTAPAQALAATPTTTPAAASMTDDRYSYYFQGRNAPPPGANTTPVPTPTPVATTTPVSPPIAATTPVAAPAVTATPAPARPYTPPADNRYADYKPTNPAVPPAASPLAVSPAVITANVTPPPVSTPTAVATPSTPVAETKIVAGPTFNATAASPPKPTGVAAQLPPGCPPLALDGYCPVTVTDKMVWKKGDVRYGALHRGRTYLFASEEEQKTFLADPDRYSPVISGNDPVIALEKGETVPGKREFGLMCQNRMFLFSSKESYDKFCSDSKRYSGEIFQALQADDLKRR